VGCVRRKRSPSGRGAGTEWLKGAASPLAEILEGVRWVAFAGELVIRDEVAPKTKKIKGLR